MGSEVDQDGYYRQDESNLFVAVYRIEEYIERRDYSKPAPLLLCPVFFDIDIPSIDTERCHQCHKSWYCDDQEECGTLMPELTMVKSCELDEWYY